MPLERLFTRRVNLFGLKMGRMAEWLGAATVVAMIFVIHGDRIWTLEIIENHWPPLTDVVGRTVFEGQKLGIGDLSVISLALVLTSYVLAWLKPASIPRLQRIRYQLGFILSAAIVINLCNVHTLKCILGRVRPERHFVGNLPYSEWFEFGPYLLPASAVSGSFPSGHTALAFVFMAFAYVLAGDLSAPPLRRRIGIAVGGMAVANAALVGTGRVMGMSHWISDCLGSIFLSWIAIHCLYYHVMSVPASARRSAGAGRLAKTPLFWELRLAGWAMFFSAGLAATISGIRTALLDGNPQLGWLSPVGVVMVLWSAIRIRAWIAATRRSAVNPTAGESASGVLE